LIGICHPHLYSTKFQFRTSPCSPDDDNFMINIREVYIETGLFSTDPWIKGEVYDSDKEIKIYYNEYPMLTIDTCPDLVTILSSKDMSKYEFAEKYDGRYFEFEAFVYSHITHDGEQVI